MDGPESSPPSGHQAFDLRQPQLRLLPLVLASPHSGTHYPGDFVGGSRLDPVSLRRSEDSFVDEIFGAASGLGVPLLAARFPRAYVDVNREAYELDPTMFSDALPGYVNVRSPRVRMGLGTIPRVVASGEEIYARKLCFAEAKQRIDALYYPYHDALRRVLDETEAAFGGYLLIDCHSMPSAASAVCGQDAADIVLGDCHGAACAPHIIEAARRFLARRGFAVAINSPYAGGFTTGHYGQPRLARHALQIEINRGLYMDERNYRRKAGLARLVREMAALIERLGVVMQDCLGTARLNAAE
jgi:N-formylglutamate amidohydrolase